MDRALPILDHLVDTGRPQSAYAIALSLGAPLSTVYGVVADLVGAEMLLRHDDGTLWLGPRLQRYGLACGNARGFFEVASQEAARLCASVEETVQICGRDGDDLVVLANLDGPGHFRVSTSVGLRVPLNWTASGRLLVGHLPRDERIAVFRRAAKASPRDTAEMDPAILADQSREAFDARLAIQDGVVEYMVACVAAPICNHAGECVASISIVLFTPRLEKSRTTCIDAVKAAATCIETSMGWVTH